MMKTTFTGHAQQHYFDKDYSLHEISKWVTEFATQYLCGETFRDCAIEMAKKLLKSEFDNGTISVCLMISTDGEIIKMIESHKKPLIQMERYLISERKKYNELLQTHPDLKFMEYGTAGRIHFDVIPSGNEEGQDIIRFKELERAPIIDLSKRQFRRSFPLSVDYRLLENTQLYGNSPQEELLLFANRGSLMDKNPIQSVVSLLSRDYGATAFRVSPLGGLITCYHNLSSTDHGPINKELCIHKSVVSKSFEFAGSQLEQVEFVTCKLPILEENAKDPLDDSEHLSLSLKHSDIAFLRSSPGNEFLIPCITELNIGEAVVCIGYPREVSSKVIKEAYGDILPELAPDREEYGELFTAGHLSISPGPLLAYNSSALACEVATTPGFSGSPVCLLKNPRMFIGIHYRARHGKDYALSISVKDAGFYHLYSTVVVPELRRAELCQEDIDAINNYLRIGGDTELIT